jgi:hypothetical protein
MAKNKVYVVTEDNQGFGTMVEVAKHLGRSRVYPKDFERFGIVEMNKEEFEKLQNQQEAEESTTEEAGLDKDDMLNRKHPNKDKEEKEAEEKAEKKAAKKEENPKPPAPKKEEKEEQPEPDKKETKEDSNPDGTEDLEFTDIEEFAMVMKNMAGEEVISLAKELELEWKEDKNKGINRMRASMALREHFFPGQRRPKAPKSPWKKFEYKELEKIANENELVWTKTEDEKINRMWVIHALKEANVEAPKRDKK